MESFKKFLSLLAGFIVIGFLFGIGPLRGINGCSCSDDDDEQEEEYYYDDSYSPSFKGGAQTGYTGPCKICDCPAYDRSSDGICECGHYKTEHTWHN